MVKFMTFGESWDAWKDAIVPHAKNIVGAPGWAAGKVWNYPIKGKKSSYYPSGEASLKELYSPEGMRKGGEWQKHAVTSRVGGWWEGLTSGSPIDTGELDESIWDKFGNVLDATTNRIEHPVGDFNLQTWINEQIEAGKAGAGNIIPEGGLIQIPELNLTPMKEGMSDFAMALAMGLGSLGQGIGGGIPSMPSMQLVDDEGEPNILLLGGLAAIAYVVLKGKK